eukprot:scaffold6819_cov51-Attheya_sp.AAC.9
MEEEEEKEELKEESEATYNEQNREEENDNESTTISRASSVAVAASIAAELEADTRDDPEAPNPYRRESAPLFHVDAMSSMTTTGVVEAIRAPDPPSSRSKLKENLRVSARQSGVGAFHVVPPGPEWHWHEAEAEAEAEQESKEDDEDDEENSIGNHIIYEGISETTNDDVPLATALATPIFDQDSQDSDTEISTGDNSMILIHATPVQKDKKMSTQNKIGMVVLIFISILIAIVIATAQTSPGPTVDNGFTSSPTPSPTVNSDELQIYLEEFSSVEDLERIGSPQRNALLWLSNRDRSGIDFTDVHLCQRYAVIVLYYATQPNILSFMDIWVDETKHECDWGGVTSCITDTTGMRRLTNIDVAKKRLQGTLPTEIGLLTDLASLDLSKNNCSGTIPEAIGTIEGLNHLALYENKLTGQLPNGIFNLRALKTLDLSTNQLSGALSSMISNLSFLKEISISHNRFIGGLQVPDIFESNGELISQLRIKYFDLSNNLFKGTIFPTINYLDQLEVFRASDNFLTGPIPQFPAKIKHIDIKGNALTGRGFDSWLLNLQGLEVLSLGGSHAGPIPSEISNLSLLRYFNARSCDLSGTLPHEIGNLQLLNRLTMRISLIPSYHTTDQLNLEGNNLTGPLPSAFGKLQMIAELYLDDNALTSTIPTALSSMRSLSVLSLENNEFSGPIPMEFSELRDLVELQLSGNGLEGSVPNGVCALGLEKLQVDRNLPSYSSPNYAL